MEHNPRDSTEQRPGILKGGPVEPRPEKAKSNQEYERLWLDLARTTRNQEEAIAAVDHALELNPGSIEARNLRIALQMGSLQSAVAPTLSSYRPSRLAAWRPVLFVLVGLVLVAGLWLLYNTITQSAQNVSVAVSTAVPTVGMQVYPATWTPVPSPTATLPRVLVAQSTTQGPRARISGTLSAYAGPSSAFQVVGIFKGTVIVPVKGRSQDSTFLQVQPENYDKLVWVPSTQVELLGGDVQALPIVVVPSPSPKPAATP